LCFYVQTFELYYPKVRIVSLVKVYAGVHYKGLGPGSHRQLQATASSDHGILSSSSTYAGHIKTLNFQNYDVYGFDLDHTLAKYKLVELFKHAYTCVIDFLVEQRGYTRENINVDFDKYKDFICKGLFLDVKQGNILKLGVDGVILRASHGTHRLSKEQIKDIYGKDMKWKLSNTFAKTLANGVEEYRFFENYFDCPGLVATARLIDIIDEKDHLTKEKKAAEYSKAWRDVIDALVTMYTPSHFADGKGGYFPSVQKDPHQFVEKCSEDIKLWLKSLRQPDKLVFLLTASQIDYASCLLKVILGCNWQSYFDISLFHARKPGFFTDFKPFYKLEGEREGEVITELEMGGCYSQGNASDFSNFLGSCLGKNDLKVLYFGDSICSDCVPSKYTDWDSVLLLEEMDAEGYLCSDGTVPGHEQDAVDRISEPRHRMKENVFQHSSLVTEEEKELLLSDFWGPFLVDMPRKNQDSNIMMNTFWGDVISRYSDITVPSLEYLAGVPLDHEYTCFTGKSGNINGFHPGPPSSLLP
ncbi:5'-nucleotidase domain-containing protein 1-like, partial [Pomacea canaliculata]|uniref:5'-nucleotidase domain-containing protein 1-like n=1 Tax=Pomacea canaliculata TaxID=400727 RepID=UPI000D738756